LGLGSPHAHLRRDWALHRRLIDSMPDVISTVFSAIRLPTLAEASWLWCAPSG
jgi:hypothetical protein